MWRSVSLAGLLFMGTVHAANPMKQDNQHVRTWNQFANQVYQLHQQLTQSSDITKKTRLGGYAQMPEFYLEEQFYLGERLISQVPVSIHISEPTRLKTRSRMPSSA